MSDHVVEPDAIEDDTVLFLRFLAPSPRERASAGSPALAWLALWRQISTEELGARGRGTS